MKLLCFAHRLEASSFFELKNYKPVTSQLFLYDDTYLLITGEGLQSATESLCEFLAQNQKITAVYNLGIAAANPQQLEINQVYSIRTLYKQRGSESMEFTSFTTNDTCASIDMVSADTRVQNPKMAQHIFSFAPMIDREAWALASVCKKFRIPFFAFKCSSDDATREACTQIRELAFEFSEKLFQFYESHLQNNRAPKVSQPPLPMGYYFTFTQKQDFEKLVHKISLKESLPAAFIIEKIPFPPENLSKKEATKFLIQNLKKRLDPFTFQVQEKLDTLCQNHTNSLIKLSYDRSLETDRLQIAAQITSTDDIQNLIQQIEKIPITKIQDILRGKNVE